MKHRTTIGLLAALAIASGLASAENLNGISIKKPFGASPDGVPAITPTMIYHGGPVLLGAVRIYVIYYGAFPSSTTDIINDFFSNVGGSGQYNVNTTYYDGSANYILNALSFSVEANVYRDNYSIGTTVTGAGVQKIIKAALQNGYLPVDTGGIYFLLTSPDVKTIGFCNSFCAYHSNSSSIVDGMDIKYALIPDPSQKCNGCDGNVAIYNQTITPNGDLGADEMTDSIMHELSETVTDPDLNAWYTRIGAENGDLCNFTYGTTYIAPNGAVANAHLGSRDYLVQEIWQNTGAGFCANTLP